MIRDTRDARAIGRQQYLRSRDPPFFKHFKDIDVWRLIVSDFVAITSTACRARDHLVGAHFQYFGNITQGIMNWRMVNLARIFQSFQSSLGENHLEVLQVFNTEHACVTLCEVSGSLHSTFVRFSDTSVPESCHFSTKRHEFVRQCGFKSLFLSTIYLAAVL